MGAVRGKPESSVPGSKLSQPQGASSDPKKRRLQVQSVRSKKLKNSPASTSTRRYRRYGKPPYSYMGMVAAAIWQSPQKSLHLSEILSSLCRMFAFFADSSYRGWHASVRHVLSVHPYFTQIKNNSVKSKSYPWSVLWESVPPEIFLVQSSRVEDYKANLFDELGIVPPVHLCSGTAVLQAAENLQGLCSPCTVMVSTSMPTPPCPPSASPSAFSAVDENNNDVAF